jgi:hypothetical protein
VERWMRMNAYRSLIALCIIMLCPMALANIYLVSTLGNDANPGSDSAPFRTIQRAADSASAGDTILVASGRYAEYVIVPRSGAIDAPITFQASGNVVLPGFSISGTDYITIKGFEITSFGSSVSGTYAIYLRSTKGVTIQDNHIHDTESTCIRMDLNDLSDHTVIRNNTISHCGYSGIQALGDHLLIDGNDISHADNFIQIEARYSVIRDNVFRDAYLTDWQPPGDPHIDGIETSPSSDDQPNQHVLIENNWMYNATDPHTHFMLLRNIDGNAVSDVILRRNRVSNIGSGFIVLSDNVVGARIYHNTIASDVIASKEYEDLVIGANCPKAKVINNIFYDNVENNGFVFYLDQSSLPGFFASSNLAYLPECGSSCIWQSTLFPYIDTILNQNPRFVSATGNFDLRLQAGSPAIDAGGALTHVAASDTLDGDRLKVDDAGMFQDGYGIVEPDWIAVGNTANVAQISSIDYAANTITLDNPINRGYNDSVFLYKDSSSRVVLSGDSPDIGAYESITSSMCTPAHEADNNPCDSCLSISELQVYIAKWRAGTVQLNSMMEAIRMWKSGC